MVASLCVVLAELTSGNEGYRTGLEGEGGGISSSPDEALGVDGPEDCLASELGG